MNKYIDGTWLKELYKPYESYEGKKLAVPIGAILANIDDAPSIDICFCKDCDFSEVIQNDSSGVMARYCRAFTVPMMRSDDDFCSYGEREESRERSNYESAVIFR